MTEVMHTQHRYSQSVGAMLTPAAMPMVAPRIEVVPNPDFSFPRLPPPTEDTPSTTLRAPKARPMSVNMTSNRPWTADGRHRRAASTLPTFSFNADNTTGLQPGAADLQPEQMPSTPSGRHRRQNSEFVGGVGLNSAISSSPTRSAPMTIPAAPGRARHRHVRSFAASSHDLSRIMAPPEPEPRLSCSLPNTPVDPTSGSHGDLTPPTNLADPFGPPLDTSNRPPSRRQVGFSENVEYIPRPLSTISSETGSMHSTMRGHSVNNSISSMLSLNAAIPPVMRARGISLETTLEDEPKSAARSSLEIGRRAEKQGDIPPPITAEVGVHRSATEPVPTIEAPADDTPKPRMLHKKRLSVGKTLGFDRRKSEPTMGLAVAGSSRLSALSLQDGSPEASPPGDESDSAAADRRFSTKRIKDWATSKISRKSRPQSDIFLAPPELEIDPEVPVAETDLEAVFGVEADEGTVQDHNVHTPVQFEAYAPSLSNQSSFCRQEPEDGTPMLDLDAALGPFNTPAPLASQKPRKILHSDRRIGDFTGPGLHYQPVHERTLSAPVLITFDQSRTGTPPQNLGVFDEEEEHEAEADATTVRPISTQSVGDEEAQMGVAVVDQDLSASDALTAASLEEGLGITRQEWELERPSMVHGAGTTRLSMPMMERRCSSIIDQTIVEEASPVDSVAIYPEESRAHSLTKSSDSSEAPTILAAPSPSEPRSLPLKTPDTLTSSAFSSPDFTRRRGSFDHSRLGTSTSSIGDNRTMSSCTTGEQNDDDVPSLTSSRSTMISTLNVNASRRDISGTRTPSLTSGPPEVLEIQRKRASIQSFSQLVGNSFGPRPGTSDYKRPQTAAELPSSHLPRKKEHRLKKLMFWKSKHRQASSATIL